VTRSSQTPPPVEEEVPFKKNVNAWKEQIHGLGSRQGPKPKATVLARTISKFTGLDWSLYSIDDKMINEHEAAGGMRTGGGNLSTWIKLVPVPLYSPQIPHDLNGHRTRAAAVGSRRLTV
jgi:hypothetical protein